MGRMFYSHVSFREVIGGQYFCHVPWAGHNKKVLGRTFTAKMTKWGKHRSQVCVSLARPCIRSGGSSRPVQDFSTRLPCLFACSGPSPSTIAGKLRAYDDSNDFELLSQLLFAQELELDINGNLYVNASKKLIPSEESVALSSSCSPKDFWPNMPSRHVA